MIFARFLLRFSDKIFKNNTLYECFCKYQFSKKLCYEKSFFLNQNQDILLILTLSSVVNLIKKFTPVSYVFSR